MRCSATVRQSSGIFHGSPFRGGKKKTTDSPAAPNESVNTTCAAAAFTENPYEKSRPGALIHVGNTLSALQRLASAYRARFSIPVVGITGSVGKTTTKEMVALALSAGKKVMCTKGNQNSQIGLPLTLFGLSPEHEAAVIEMGMSEFGEIDRLAEIVEPNIGIITNIGVAHMETLGSREGIFKAKMEITRHICSDGGEEGTLIFANDENFLTRESTKGNDRH
ncbi:hypothetical protein KH017_16970 [bacterium]|nr:hypothetical protein [bacterium]